MIQLKYVGKKPEHEDALFGTGTWKKGEVRKVDAKLAPFMLYHDGVWKDARTAAQQKSAPITPAKTPRSQRPDKDREHDVVHVPFHNLDKKGLQSLAKNTFNRDLPDMPLPQMRAEIRQMMRMRP